MKNVAIYLMGGLGNQLFQYFHALKLKEEENTVYLLADWFAKPKQPGTTLREFHLHGLPQIDLPIVFSSDLLERGYIMSPYGFEEFSDKLVEFKMGYFQNASDMPTQGSLENFYRTMPTNSRFAEITSIHIRLGDYVKLGWRIPVKYYENIFAANPDTRFVVFCEDEAETRQFLSGIKYNNYVFANEIDAELGNNPVADFIAMGSSMRCFGSNSTFSYLAGLAVGFRGGAYISPNNQYWDWFDQDRMVSGRSLLDYRFITREN